MSVIKVVIPARYGSTRFPGKPLALIAGEPMILRVVERAALSGVGEVIVATDDQRIKSLCDGNDVQCVLTAIDHPSGTDRLAEVAKQLEWSDDTIVVNLQGDEPLMPPQLIRQVANALISDESAAIATLATPLENKLDVFNPNVVKVVMDKFSRAIYFSRASIPWSRSDFDMSTTPLALPKMHRHLGIYAYRVGFLARYPEMEVSPLEEIEALEQLRAIWHGEKINVAVASEMPGPGVDIPDDVIAVEALIGS